MKSAPTLICGADPGLNGAFVVIDLANSTLKVFDMPTFEKNGKRHVNAPEVGTILKTATPHAVFLEFVHASPQMGVSSSFSFGRSSGVIHGVCGALDLPLTEIAPSVWKPRMGATADKKQTAAQAAKLLPQCAPLWKLVKHVDRAEAALIALYGICILGLTVPPNLTPVS